MKVFKIEDLYYNGATNGVHSWTHPQGTQPYYWHPDWLHVAEDITGLHGKHDINVEDGTSATEDHAKKTIIDHLNDE
ncbi:hypothetical protein [Vibrio sp. NTOU-M3]|uniref:hypothetical protein n=1 Tax=unclassified Vibrio TaxID=2614977 RepID=UPI00349F4B81